MAELPHDGLRVERDWFAAAGFSQSEQELVLGTDGAASIRQANYGWLAEYLHHEAGLPDWEVADWFRCGHRILGNTSPMALWQEDNGFERVLEAAQLLAEETGDLKKEHPRVIFPDRWAERTVAAAVEICEEALLKVGSFEPDQRVRGRFAVCAEDSNIAVSWKSDGSILQEYKAVIPSSSRTISQLCLVLVEEKPFRFSIDDFMAGQQDNSLIQADFDPAPVMADIMPFASAIEEKLKTAKSPKVISEILVRAA